MTSNAEERKHHPFSPSTLANREACPCYKGRDEANAAAIAGTLQHTATEKREDDNDLTDEQALRVADCIDFFDRRVQLMIDARARVVAGLHVNGRLKMATCEKRVPKVTTLAEKYWRVDTLADDRFKTKETTGGFADAFVIDHTRSYAEGFDWKFGLWEVEQATDNVQGWAYVIGFFREYQTVQSVLFWFYQPAIERVSSHLFKRSDIPAQYLRIQAIVERAKLATLAVAKGDWSAATPKVPACNFCDRIGQCPKILDYALRVSKKYLPLEFPDSVTPTNVLDRKQSSLALRLSQVLKIWAEGFRATTTDRVLRGDADMPDGYTLGTSARREVVNPAKFKEVALRYLTLDEYYNCLPIEFGKIEKAIQDRAPRGAKKAAVEAFQKVLADEQATEKGTPYAFLRVKSSTAEKSETDDTTQTQVSN